MTRSTKTWLVATAVLVGYLLVAVVVALLLKLHGTPLWVLIAVLALAGIVSAIVVVRFMRAQDPGQPRGAPAGSTEATLATARVQLAAARHVANPKFGSLPVMLVLGPDGSTKTTTIVRSGLEPELVAGDVFRGDTVAPTAGINVWYAQNTVLVEAGGRLATDAPGWQQLVRAIRPRSFTAALSGRPQPPRLAVVCVACDDFYRPGSGEAVPAAARALRARLGEAAKAFGVALPTYVVFTKLDSVPHFEAFVRNFSADESREPLGAGVLPDSGGAGTYADRMTPNLERAFDELYASLAERRVAALSREHGAEWKPGAYEFPREFAKLKPLAVDFLRELGRPSELEVSPVLRGFYFTGVQAVFVTETAQEYVPAPTSQATAGARSATAVFSAGGGVAAPAAAQAGGATRKVPRWNFLPRVMREVVLGDQAAVRLTAAGARVGFWRRLGLGTLAVVATGLAIAFAISYSGNRTLEQRAIDATRGIASLPPNPVDLPTVDALTRLDALRTQVDTLSGYAHAGAPTHLRWGLYAGNRLYPEVRSAYFGGFDKLMFANTRAAMRATLSGLPDAPRPTDDYGETYSLLKAYIITTSHPEKSTTEFLSPALMTRWLASRSVDSSRAQLARKQFDTYATELRYANPFPDTADAATVGRARSFLRQFAGSERIYQFMLAEAGKTNPSIQFNRAVAGSGAYVTDSYEVPGAFTKGGAAFMLTAFKTVDKYLKGESWVVGDDAGQVDKAKLIADLRTRYTTDYIGHWRKFLQSASVVRYSGVKDAAQKLAMLSGNQSPLLALFATASRNTAPDGLPELAAAFQPVQAVTPPAVTDKLIGPTNAPYVGALLTLQSSLDQTANAQGPAAEAAAGQAAGNAAAAKTAARQIASTFSVDDKGQVHAIVQALMEAPVTYAEPLLRNFGSAEINVRARAFCAVARPLLAKFPFAPDASAQASLAEVAAVLRPRTGSLWKFYDEALATTLPKQGNQYVPAPGNVKLAPGFVNFINRAATFADVLFKDDSPEPHLSFSVQPAPSAAFSSVTVSLDGLVIRSTLNGNIETARVDWPGAAHEAKLSAGLGATEVVLIGPYSGPWAIFQLFGAADDWTPSGSGYRVGWELSTRAQRAVLTTGSSAKVTVQIDAGAAAPVLRKNFFAGSDCSGDIAR